MKYITYEDILEINMWCQNISKDVITITYGIRDKNLLQSIPLSIQQTYDGIEVYKDIYEKTAYVWKSLSQYHCFNDGNKRTALVSTLVFLLKNNKELKIKDDLYDICIRLAESKLDNIFLRDYVKENAIFTKNERISLKECLKYLEGNLTLVSIIIKLGY